MKTMIETIGDRIKSARKEANKTQADLSNDTGISITQISNYENNSRPIGINNLAKISNATKKSIDELYFGSTSKRIFALSKNTGELIVYCLLALLDESFIGLLPIDIENSSKLETFYHVGFTNNIDLVGELVCSFVDFENNKENYNNPEDFKKQLIDAYINKFNKRLMHK